MQLTGELVGGKIINNSLRLSNEEYTKLMNEEPLQKMIACSSFSGVITLTFKKNSPERHKQLIL